MSSVSIIAITPDEEIETQIKSLVRVTQIDHRTKVQI